jgi:glycosyltransferase involved in cell wall biosynthesis
MERKLLFVVNHVGYFLSHRLPIALAAQNAGFEVHIAAPEGSGKAALLGYEFTHHTWAMTRGGKNPFIEIALLWRLVQIFRKVKPDILHLVTIKPVLYGGIAARLTGIGAVVAAITGLGFIFSSTGMKAGVLRFFATRLYRIALRHPRLCVIFQNRDDAEVISRLAALTPGEIFLIRGSGVNLNQYSFSPLPSFVEAPVVVLAARLLKSKGVPEFINAAHQLRRRNVRARFVLVGMSDMENPETVSEDIIADCVKEGVIEHWGYREDMPKVLAQSTLVVLPSWREGMPKVLLEAAAVGRAVVTTDAPGCRDAIIPGVTGLLIPPRDADALADAMEQLLNDRAQLQTMGKTGRELAEREFDVRHVVIKHLEIYQKLLAKDSEKL